MSVLITILFVFFKNFYLLILETGGGRERETEKHQFVVPLIYVFIGRFFWVP